MTIKPLGYGMIVNLAVYRNRFLLLQVHYAAVFAYGALNIFLEMISAKIIDFKTDVSVLLF